MALPESTSQDGQKNNKQPQQQQQPSRPQQDQEDKDFDPSAEAMIDEIDDERTLEEEEALNGGTGVAVQEELDDLKKESEMPIEELLAYYERMRNQAGQAHGEGDEEEEEEDDDYDDEEEEEEDNEDDDEDDEAEAASSKATTTSSPKKSHVERPSSSGTDQQQHQQSHQQPPQDPTAIVSNSTSSTPAVGTSVATTSATAVSNSQSDNVGANASPRSTSDEIPQQQQERPRNTMTNFLLDDGSGDMMYDYDESDDADYSVSDDDDEREWRRSIHVGPEHQADVPEGLCEYGDVPPYENKDILVWRNDGSITDEQIVDYLKQASLLAKRTDISISPASVPKISTDGLRLYRERMQDITTTSSAGPRVIEQNINENINIDPQNPHNQQTQPHYHHLMIQQQHPQLQSQQYPPENLQQQQQQQQDLYMSQSRKRVRIDYELEQENAMDGMVYSCGGVGGASVATTTSNVAQTANQISSSVQRGVGGDADNCDSVSQDTTNTTATTTTTTTTTKPEPSQEDYFQDEEQLLYLLLQCNYNTEEALRRRKLDPFKYYLYDPMTLWSEEECLGFEQGLRMFGKNFGPIRENAVPTRSHAEVVAFYYLWKKSERHDVYTNQYKLDRKRCLSHPGTTDYMDKFIEDNESTLNQTSSNTPTPNLMTSDNSANNISNNNHLHQTLDSTPTTPSTINLMTPDPTLMSPIVGPQPTHLPLNLDAMQQFHQVPLVQYTTITSTTTASTMGPESTTASFAPGELLHQHYNNQSSLQHHQQQFNHHPQLSQQQQQQPPHPLHGTRDVTGSGDQEYSVGNHNNSSVHHHGSNMPL